MENTEPSIQSKDKEQIDPPTQSDNKPIEPPSFNYEVNKYYGVGGWLALFCVGLTIINPLFRLRGIVASLANIDLIAARYPSVANIIYIEDFLQLVLIAFSIYAGYLLWKIKPNAVYIAKTYLVAVVFFAVFDIFLVQMAGFPEDAARQATTQAFIGVAQSLFYGIIWFAYLSKSERVRATYGEPLDENNFK